MLSDGLWVHWMNEHSIKEVSVPDADLNDGEFMLGKPAIVCRWRLSNKTLPLENRHLRALGARHTSTRRVQKELVAWAKQHIEWTLGDGAAANPDGVLMMIVDTEGRAAMSVGPYEELEDTRLAALCARADLARREAEEVGVAPEALWLASEGTLIREGAPGMVPAGAVSLVTDLAKTMGIHIKYVDDLLEKVQGRRIDFDEAFLVSDEHGVVPASDYPGPEGRRFSEGYERLLERAKKKCGPCWR